LKFYIISKSGVGGGGRLYKQEKQLINKLVIGTEVEKQLVHTLFIKWYRLLFFETHQRKCLNLGGGVGLLSQWSSHTQKE